MAVEDTKKKFKVIDGQGKDWLNDTIGVNFVSFQRHEETTWQDLFSGFQHIRILTYSFGLPFVERLVSKFDDGEIIIGSNSQMSLDAAELIAMQTNVVNYVSQHKHLQEMIYSGNFHMYVAKDILSHGKIYLLKSDENPNRVRVITGSANASERAWNGSQVENYDVCDDLACYEIYLEGFNLVKELSTNEITKEAREIREDLSNIDEVPVLKEIRETKEAIVLHDAKPDEEIRFAFIVGNLSEKMETLLKKANIRPSMRQGGTLIDADRIRRISVIAKKDAEYKKEEQLKCPSLRIDYLNQNIFINDKLQDLAPEDYAVKNDMDCWLQYLSGFDEFTGDIERLKQTAWMILNYTFVSPFIAELRYRYAQLTDDYDIAYPMYLILIGPKSNGKSAVVKVCQKLVLGMDVQKVDRKNFRQKELKSLDETVIGCPVLIDDITKTDWQYSERIVKSDRVLVDCHLENHPCYMITSNDVETSKDSVIKRIIVMRVQNQIGADRGKELVLWVRKVTR